MNKKINISKNFNKTMIAFLKEDMEFSGRSAKKLLKNSLVLLNNKRAYGDTRIKGGDIIHILGAEKKEDYIVPQNLKLSILFEDEFILIVDKPPFMSMLPGKTNEGTLANGVRYYFDQNNIKEPVRFYNRLDMNTSGIVLVPKDSQTHSLLDRYSSETIVKKYQAVVLGIPKVGSGIIKKPISMVADEKGKRIVTDRGKPAITKYTLVETFKNSSLLDIHLKTGRTHQIRIHLSSIRHPIIGDTLYGVNTKFIGRQALHSYKLEFFHPIQKQGVIIESPLPEDMKKLISILKEKYIVSFGATRNKLTDY